MEKNKVSDYIPRKSILHVRMDKNLKLELEQAAKKEGTTLTKLIIAMTRHYLKK